MIDPITSSNLARNISDAVTSVASGKSIDQVRLEKSNERVIHDQKIIEKETRDQKYREVLKEQLIKENISKGMDAETASKLAGIQAAIGKVATIPGAGLAHKAIQPLAFAMDKTLFDGEAIAQSVAKGKDVSSKKDDRSNEKLSDAIDRLTDQMYNSDRF